MNLEFAESRPPLSFFVTGQPAPGGSKRYVGQSKKTGRAILVDMGGERNRRWRACVAETARSLRLKPFKSGPLLGTFEFTMPRPKYHFYSDKKRFGQLRPDAPIYHTVAPDTTKLVRSTEDALKGITWDDDSQIAVQTASKVYGETPGCKITITQL
jgi:Holliday junction resolvase RusA-like endonuclease